MSSPHASPHPTLPENMGPFDVVDYYRNQAAALETDEAAKTDERVATQIAALKYLGDLASNAAQRDAVTAGDVVAALREQGDRIRNTERKNPALFRNTPLGRTTVRAAVLTRIGRASEELAAEHTAATQANKQSTPAETAATKEAIRKALAAEVAAAAKYSGAVHLADETSYVDFGPGDRANGTRLFDTAKAVEKHDRRAFSETLAVTPVARRETIPGERKIFGKSTPAQTQVVPARSLNDEPLVDLTYVHKPAGRRGMGSCIAPVPKSLADRVAAHAATDSLTGLAVMDAMVAELDRNGRHEELYNEARANRHNGLTLADARGAAEDPESLAIIAGSRYLPPTLYHVTNISAA